MIEINNRSWYKKWWGVLIIVAATFILALFTAFGFYVFDLIKKIKGGNLPADIALSKTINEKNYKIALGNENNYWFGSANPKITIVEFADFSCPYCQKSFLTIREIGLKYKNNVKIIFRDFPVRNESSLLLSLAARCAGEQGLFWVMHDKLFQYQKNEGVYSNSDLINLAKQIGADTEKFKSCLAAEKYLTQIQKDFSDGELLGVKGTPAWFINGHMISGDVPGATWEKIIKKMAN
jgi:protein-disulfide isomerase